MSGLVAQIPKANGSAPEDSAYARGGLLVVADGVTRTPTPPAPYPDPSPAALAADVIVTSVVQAHPDRPTATRALASANDAVYDLNTRLGLWTAYNEGSDDLAGAVAAVACVDGALIEWAYIGDCGIAAISSDGTLAAITPDDIEPLRHRFPPHSAPPHLRMATVRGEYRNLPPPNIGFGVLTGEPTACVYIRGGNWSLPHGGGAVLVFSDGARSMLGDLLLRQLIVSRHTDTNDVVTRLREVAASRGIADEATISVIRS